MRRSSLIILTAALVSSTVIATSPLPSTSTDSPTKFEFKRHHRGSIHSSITSKSNSSKEIKIRDSTPAPITTPPPGTYEASPGDYPRIDGSDGTADNLTLMSAFKYGSTFFPLAMLAVVSSGILVCFFLIAVGKACAHRKKFADPLDYEDGMPEVKKEPLPFIKNKFDAPEARRDWEWDQKVDDSKKDNYEAQNKSTSRLVDEPINDRVLSISSSKVNAGEYGMPKVPARSHRDVGAQNARNINNNKSRHLTSTTIASNNNGAHPLSHHETIGSYSEQGSQHSSSYSQRSRSSSVDSYDEFSPPSPRSPNNDPPSPRSPNNNNNSSTQQPPRSILSNGGVQITQPRPLFINPLPSPTTAKSNLNGLGSPNNKLPSPGSNAGSPTFMSHLQNTKPLAYSNSPTSPTTPFSSGSAAPQLLPHLRFAPIALDAPPKKNKRFSAISTPLSNRFSLASSNWSFQAPPTPTLPPGPIEQSIMNDQQTRQFQQEQFDLEQDYNSRTGVTELPYHLGPSESSLDYPPKSPHSNLASPKALAYVERPRTDSIGGFSGVTSGTGGGRKSKRDVVSGVYSGYTPSNFTPSVKSPKFLGKK